MHCAAICFGSSTSMPRLLYSIALVWLAWAAAFCAAQAQSAAPEVAEPFLVRQTTFTLPFRLEPARKLSEQPVEVQLYSSADQGASWQLAGRVKPDVGKFLVRAANDGEIWFCIRTLDAQGATRPEGPPRAEQRVVIDTAPPRVELSAEQGASGEVSARWQAVDPNLQAESLKIEYQAEPNGSWERVAVENPAAPASRSTLSGSATWWPKIGAGPMLVRATVSDRAGNPAVTQARLVKGAQTAAVGNSTPTLADPHGTQPPQQQPPPQQQGGSQGWPTDKVSEQPFTQLQGRPAAPQSPGLPSSVPAAGAFQFPAAFQNSSKSPLQKSPAAAFQNSTMRQGQPAASAGAPTATDQWTQGAAMRAVSTQRPVAGATLNLDMVPAGERPRLVNSRTFELDYEVQTVGPSGIAKVELWGTRDGGRTWSSFGLDSDNRSPMVVSVEGEGVYGFRVVFQSGTGFGGQPPRDADMADIWVAVDLTEPRVKILGTDIGRDAGELVIRWEGSDKLLDAHPTSLAYSAQPRGPWTPIAADLDNTGTYPWRLDNRVPEKVYLRVELRDQAGNIGAYETPDPIPLDRQRPQGRIRGVRSVRS